MRVTQIHHQADGTVTLERRLETQGEARDRARAEAQAVRDNAEALRDKAEIDRDRRQVARDQARASRDEALVKKDMPNVRIMVAHSLDQARAGMVQNCAARGTPVSADERDWNKLAVCDKAAFNAQVIRSMEQARAQLVRDRDVGDDERETALDALDGAIARMKARGIS
jgi:hypothetical protein